MQWGLIPSWSKQAKGIINARSETIEEKPSFRESFQRQRCLIPADGFYEWQRSGKIAFQQKIEWVRLREKYPEKFEDAKRYEYANKKNGNAFYCNGDEPLEELEKPERIEEIKRKWEESRERLRKSSPNLIHILGGLEEEDEESEACLICHL